MSTRPILGRPPLVLVVPAVVAALFLVVPLVALVLETPWRDLVTLVRTEAVLEALRLTVVTSLATVGVCVVVGTPLAWVLARVPFPGRGCCGRLVVVPLVLPPVVAGVTLISAFGRGRLIGGPLEELTGYTRRPIHRARRRARALVRGDALATCSPSRAPSAPAVPGSTRWPPRSGAGRWTTFRRVTLPLALPGLVAGCVLAWARSLGEFGATITFAGNYEGTTRTMPSLIYTELQRDDEVARTLSLILLVVSVVVLAALRDRWLRVP